MNDKLNERIAAALSDVKSAKITLARVKDEVQALCTHEFVVERPGRIDTFAQSPDIRICAVCGREEHVQYGFRPHPYDVKVLVGPGMFVTEKSQLASTEYVKEVGDDYSDYRV